MLPHELMAITATMATLTTAQTTRSPQPVLTLPYTAGIMDATLKHLCLYSKSNIFNISFSLDPRGEGKCPSSCCGTTNGHLINTKSCHLAPFSHSYEADGSNATAGCVSAYEAAFQGWWLGRRLRDIKGARDTYFGDTLPMRIEIEGLDCASVKEEDVVGANIESDAVAICAADNPERTLASGVEKRFIPPSVAQNSFGDEYGLVIVPFGDVVEGKYVLEANIMGEAFDVRLWDSVGDDMVVGSITPDENNHVSIPFSGPRTGVGLMLATNSTNAEIAWELKSTAGGSTGSGSGVVTKTLPPATSSAGEASGTGPGSAQQTQTDLSSGSGTARPSATGVLSNGGSDGSSIWASTVSGVGAFVGLMIGLIL